MCCTENIIRSFDITKKEKPIENCNSTAYPTTYDPITNLRNTRISQPRIFLVLVLNHLSFTKEFPRHRGNASQIGWQIEKEKDRNKSISHLHISEILFQQGQSYQWLRVSRYQQAHPPAWGCVRDEAPPEDFRFTSTMSSCFVEESASIPGKAAAIFRNNGCTKFHRWSKRQNTKSK